MSRSGKDYQIELIGNKSKKPIAQGEEAKYISPKLKMAITIENNRNNRKSNKTKKKEISLTRILVGPKIAYDIDEFSESLKNYASIMEGDASAAIKKATYKKIVPELETLHQCIELLKKPSTQKELGVTEATEYLATCYNNMATVYFLNNDITNARKWFSLGAELGNIFSFRNLIGCNLKDIKAQQTHCTIALIKELYDSQYALLNKANHDKIFVNHEDYNIVNFTLNEVISLYKKRGQLNELETLANNYHKLFSREHFSEIINMHALSSNYEKVIIWVNKYFAYLRKESQYNLPDEYMKINITECAQSAISCYFIKSNLLEATLFVETNKSLFDMAALTDCANIFLSSSAYLPESYAVKVKSWLTTAMKAKELEAFNVYLNHCFLPQYEASFSAVENLEVLREAMNFPACKTTALYITGTLYSSGKIAGYEQNDEQAFQYYSQAAKEGHIPAMHELAKIYQNGNGAAIDNDACLYWLKKTFEAGSVNCFQNLILGLINYEKQNEIPDLLEKAESFLSEDMYTLEQEERKKLESEIHFSRGYYIFSQFYKSLPNEKWQSKEFHKAVSSLKKSAEMGNLVTKSQSYFFLIILHIDPRSPFPDYDFAEKTSLTAIDMIMSNHNLIDDRSQALMCHANILNLKLTLAKTADDKATYREQALKYYQEALYYGHEKNDVSDYFDQLIKDLQSEASSSAVSQEFFNSLSINQTPSIRATVNLKSALTNLGAILEEKDTASLVEPIAAVTAHIKASSEVTPHYINSKLVKIAERISIDAHKYSTMELLTILHQVSHWHIATAVDKLKPIVMFIKSEDLTSKELAEACYIIATCGLESQDKQALLDKLINFTSISMEYFLGLIAQLKLSELSRLFYSFAILDATIGLPNMSLLAPQILKLLANQNAETTYNDISKIYHVLFYFKLKYPDTSWAAEKLTAALQNYELNLKKKAAVHASNTQIAIYQLMNSRNPQVSIEAFIPTAGRRVDFLLENTVIQYHGSRDHYYYNSQGMIEHTTAKDELCNATLKLAGYGLIIISHEEWNEFYGDPQAQIKFLKNRIPNLVTNVVHSTNRNLVFATTTPSNTNLFEEKSSIAQFTNLPHRI